MRLLSAGATTALLTCSLAAAADASGSCATPLDAPLRSRAALTIESRPAKIEIVGTDQNVIHVSCTVDHALSEDVRLLFQGTSDEAKLTVGGGPMRTENLDILIQVPRRINLQIHTPAGEVTVKQIAGDKDIDLYAGQITITSADVAIYRSVDASVDIGDVKASAWGIDKGGFFRSFTKMSADGEYRLRAHVITGQIDLQ